MTNQALNSAKTRATLHRCVCAGGGAANAGHALLQLCADTWDVTRAIADAAPRDAELPYRVAGDYLALTGWLLLACAWARALRLSEASSKSEPFYEHKRTTARHFFAVRLTEFAHCKRLVEAGIGAALPFVDLEPAFL